MDVFDSDDDFLLPDLICNCNRRNLNRLVYPYYERAVQLGEAVRKTQIDKYLAIRNSSLKGLKKQNALNVLQEDGKDEMQKGLREIFTSLGIMRDCCRIHVAGALRGKYLNSKDGSTLVDVTFEPEDYYDLNKIYIYLTEGNE